MDESLSEKTMSFVLDVLCWGHSHFSCRKLLDDKWGEHLMRGQQEVSERSEVKMQIWVSSTLEVAVAAWWEMKLLKRGERETERARGRERVCEEKKE